MFEDLPDAWAPGLVKLRGKKPIEKGFNTTAAERWESGEVDGLLEEIIKHVKSGGNVGMVPPLQSTALGFGNSAL